MGQVGFNLGAPGYLEKIAAATADVDVQLVFNNAGYMLTGFFENLCAAPGGLGALMHGGRLSTGRSRPRCRPRQAAAAADGQPGVQRRVRGGHHAPLLDPHGASLQLGTSLAEPRAQKRLTMGTEQTRRRPRSLLQQGLRQV
jgi:hypothetical protein